MINVSDRPLVLRTGQDLHSAILAALSSALNQLGQILAEHARPIKINRHPFSTIFGAQNHKSKAIFDINFVNCTFDISQDIASNSNSKEARTTLKRYLEVYEVPADSIPEIKRGLKLTLVDLWRQGAVLLPTCFNAGQGFPIEIIDHPLLKWIRSLVPEAPKADAQGNTVARRLYYHGHRLLWATDWVKNSDISLTDIGALQRAASLYRNQVSQTVIGSPQQIPFSALAAKALESFGTEVPFNAEDLKHFSKWSLGKHALTLSFEDYRNSGRSGAPKEEAPKRPRPKSAPNLAATLELAENELDLHEALKSRFTANRSLRRGDADWTQNETPVYLGREHVDLSAISSAWLTAMRAFLHHRVHVKELRTDGEALAVLNILADYLFFYLPWWAEIADAPRVSLPKSPREFSRYLFLTRHPPESLDVLPATLLEVIRWRRRSKESIASAVKQLALFFSFVEMHFADNESIAGGSFRSPIKPEFDAPRIDTKHKTNKEIIPKHLYGYLLFYAYALEEVGMKLESQALAGTLQRNSVFKHSDRWLNLGDFGISASVQHRTSSHLLHEVPNVFSWASRPITDPEGATLQVDSVPHCTALRLLITAIETGLRGQSVQWLDRRTWRSRGEKFWTDSYTFPLLVNTDKVRTEPWETPVVYRVRDMLKRQEVFQDQFADANDFGPVLYEGSPNAPFDPIEPLFRSPVTGNPVTDQHYSTVWLLLMIGFEAFYRQATGENHVRLYHTRPIRGPDGDPIVRPVNNSSELLWCPLSTVTVHTPHACRATFATNRKGVLALTDTARLLGHSSEVVTSHYDKPTFEDLQDRLRTSDESICKDFLQFDAESEVHVRADKAESALVRSFSRDRGAAIKRFGFVPSVTLWASSDSLDEDGLQLLKEGPMSRIRFRETHICPVGEECPLDVIERIGAPKRCGCCPLAMRCIDHLPAIAAKRNQLLERVRYLHERIEVLQARGEPASVLDEQWDELELDVNEYLGWQLSEQVLNSVPRDDGPDADLTFHVEQPEVVKRHLQRVSRLGSPAAFVLQRIADSNAYPSMTSPQIQAAAARVKRSLLARKGTSQLTWEDDSLDSVRDAAMMLSLAMKSSGLSREQVAGALTSQRSELALVQVNGVSDGG